MLSELSRYLGFAVNLTTDNEFLCTCVCVCVQENWRDGYVKLCTPTSLPELKDRPQDFYDKFRSRQGQDKHDRNALEIGS